MGKSKVTECDECGREDSEYMFSVYRWDSDKDKYVLRRLCSPCYVVILDDIR